MNALTASTVAGNYRHALTLIAQGEDLMYVNLTEWVEARRQGVSLSDLRKATGVSRDYANALIHLGRLVEASGHRQGDALPDRGWDALRMDVDAIVRDNVATLEDLIGDMDGTEGLPGIDALLVVAGDKARASRKRKDRATNKATDETPDTGEETPDEGETATPAPTRGNAALIADALAALARVNVETMTDEEATALASLVKQATAMGRAWLDARQETRKAS